MSKLKIVFLAPANNYHTKKWCKWFKDRGHNVSVISLVPADNDIEADVYYLESSANANSSDRKKILYLTKIDKVRTIVNKIKPNIINVHYATSYGSLAAFSGLKNYFLFIWGTDIYTFPRKSMLHKWLLKVNLMRASILCSTSKAMAIEASRYTKKKITIIPFGVDTELFCKKHRQRNDKYFVIGTMKALEPVYGIGELLIAVSRIKKEYSYIPLKIRLAGRGSYENEYHRMAEELGLGNCLTWLGYISQSEVAKEWANLDCAIIPSRMESFGVAAVEAQACECPVIITDIPGLMEATHPGVSSLVVKRYDIDELVQAIKYMYDNPVRRSEMGKAGRQYVKDNFEINKCFMKAENMFYQQKI